MKNMQIWILEDGACTARREDKITAQHNKVVRRENTRARRKRCLEMQKQKCKIKTQEHQRSPTASWDGRWSWHTSSGNVIYGTSCTHSYNIKAHTHIIAYIQPYARTHLIHTLRITTNTVANSYHSHEHRSRPVNQDYSVILSHMLSQGSAADTTHVKRFHHKPSSLSRRRMYSSLMRGLVRICAIIDFRRTITYVNNPSSLQLASHYVHLQQ